MPKFRKRSRRPSDTGGNTDASLPTLTTSSTRNWSRHKPQYRHYAANIRYSGNGHDHDDVHETSTPPSTNVAIGIFIVCFLICFGSTPDATLRMILLGQTLFCIFPPFFPNWVVLLVVLLPMKTQSRTEVVLGFAMLSWISSLEWFYAWERISHKINRGQDNDRDGMLSEV